MLKVEILKRLEKVRLTRAKKMGYDIEEEHVRKNEKPLYDKGISVIIPTYKGEKVIKKCLTSLADQTIDHSLFEVIIVINGEKDKTEEMIGQIALERNMSNIRVVTMDEAGASIARNKGISLAAREYVTFLDDDDYFSANFLEEMYKQAKPDTAVISQIYNVEPDGNIQSSNPINRQILKSVISKQSPYMKLHTVLTINACKLIPTLYVQKYKFDESLKSGEDVVFFTELFVKNDLKFAVASLTKKAVYYRTLRENSISRQAMTFNFNVEQRADCIEKMNELLVPDLPFEKRDFIERKINAQVSFIVKYYEEHKDEYDRIMKEISSRRPTYFPYHLLNKDRVEQLVVSYCFPPYNDTAGNVMAKRMRQAGKVSDVIYNTMDKVRTKNASLNQMVDDLIHTRLPINSPSSFSHWAHIKTFVDMGMKGANELVEKNGVHKQVFSRAMWAASHFLAYEYKKKYPQTKWVAEFSDPLIYDIEAKKRLVDITDQGYLKQLEADVKKAGYPSPNDASLFVWCEYLPYIFADELIFTNKNQYQYMMDMFPIEEIKPIIKQKVVIEPHPTLSESYYHMEEFDYPLLSEDHVNVAYFGNFYSKRNLNDLFSGLKEAHEDTQRKVLIHVFTAKPTELEDQLKNDPLEDSIIVNGFVDFYTFLNLCTKFDCLVVNDSTTKDNKPINPYLPSKLSDYKGSGTDIWGVYEEGSILGQSEGVTYLSPLNDARAAGTVFDKMVAKKFSGKKARKLEKAPIAPAKPAERSAGLAKTAAPDTVFEKSWVKKQETELQHTAGTDQEELERLSRLADRLIQDKKEMEQEFKTILTAIADDVESRENLGELISKQEAAGLKTSGISPEMISAGQEQQKKLLEEKERTISELQTKLTKLQNSKLGKLQLKYWGLKRRK
ncbi:glycosyltransferase [Metabacillus indicus]|uniref:glycosyltransferase family 2 protein n=1 Tax=Metabacillus indicus TaxID=246786 RepID=UPI002A019AA6|nr:glycosyltransferase [Metabacillus indicus]MDX8288973.1 glycosyltransferase [Metabacillus indicus]